MERLKRSSLTSGRKNSDPLFWKPSKPPTGSTPFGAVPVRERPTCLQEIQKGLEAAGRNAYYLAPTAAAVEVLRRDGFSQATTVHDFLGNQVKTHSEQIHQSVLVIDESSLLSTQLGAALLKTSQIHDARVLFVGDVRQHVSVEAGDFLRVLEQHSKLGFSELQDIRRQIPADYNRAIRLMARGDVSEGLERLDQLGCIHEGKGNYLRRRPLPMLKRPRRGNPLTDASPSLPPGTRTIG